MKKTVTDQYTGFLLTEKRVVSHFTENLVSRRNAFVLENRGGNMEPEEENLSPKRKSSSSGRLGNMG